MWSKLHSLDLYSQSIEFTVNKHRRFRTKCGVIASVLTVTVMLLFGLMRILGNPERIEFHKGYDPISNQTVFNMSEFSLGFGFHVDPSHGYWKVDSGL